MKANLLRRIQRKIIINYIQSSNDIEIHEIAQAITHRYKTRFPDWDVTLLSLPNDPAERERILTWLIDFYRNIPQT